MSRTAMTTLAVSVIAAAALCRPGLARQEQLATESGDRLPAMSDTEHEAVFASAVNTERRYRNRLARLRRLRDIAREQGDQRRVHELEQLMDDNHRLHAHRIARLSDMVDGQDRRDLLEAVAEGRQESVDWAPPLPSVTDVTVRRHLRVALKSAPGGRVRTVARRAPGGPRAERQASTGRSSLIRRHVADAPKNARLQRLRPELKRHLSRLKAQKQADAEARRISPATAEAEYQLLRQEIAAVH